MKSYRNIFGIIVLLSISFVTLSFDKKAEDKERIIWNTGKQLTWEDFQGIPNNASGYGAITSSGMDYSYHYQGSNLTIEVKSVFFKKNSWVKPQDRDADGLKHEQGHFDIAELYARKLRKALREATFTKRNVKAKLNDIYKSNSKAWEKEENKYDKETDHHRNRANQLLWNERIAKELSKLENYTEMNISATIQ